jgi:hypothetical protein
MFSLAKLWFEDVILLFLKWFFEYHRAGAIVNEKGGSRDAARIRERTRKMMLHIF